MLDTLQSDIVSISETELNSLFDIPGIPSAKDLPGAKDTEEPVKKVKDNETVVIDGADGFLSDIENVKDIDDLLNTKKEEKPKEEVKKDVKDTKEDKTEVKKEEKEGEDKELTEDDIHRREVLKNTAKYLIEKGEWFDFDGSEDMEIDEKTYAELAIKQNQARVSSMFNEMIDSTGPYGKAIIGFIKQGGDPEQVIDIFKEQKQIENFDTNSEEGKRLLITKYYKEVTGWKPEKIERHIKSLIASDELETETSEVKDLFDQHNKEKLAEIAHEQRQEIAKQKEREERFKDTITSAIKERKDLSDREKAQIEKSVLQYSNRLADGTQVSDFYVKFAKLQSDPKEYIDLVSFVMDKDNYLKKLKTDIKNKVTDKEFSFIKGNQAVATTKGSNYEKIDRSAKKVADFQWFSTEK